ncbi:MAG TPA: S9 family peptidase [Rhodanobacteraceae bacterium]|nr:S9 family peptidase [Rhodanobacteraceae bacterium]
MNPLRTGLLVAASLVLSIPAAAASRPRQYSIEQLMAADSFGSMSFSPDDSKIVTTSVRSGIANLYVVPVDGGKPRQITHSTKETIASIGYFPHDERILYSSDQGGNELAHLYVRELDGRTRDVTPGEHFVARFVDWAQDGNSFYAVTNQRDPHFFDLYEISTKDYSKQLIFRNDKGYEFAAVSPDRRYIVLSRIIDNANIHIYVHDRKQKKMVDITPGKAVGTELTLHAPVAFAPNSDELFYASDEGGKFTHLLRRDLATGKTEVVFKPKWSVVDVAFSKDGRYLLATVDEDARDRPYLLDAKTFKPVSFGDPWPNASVGLLLANRSPLALLAVTDGTTPDDVYLLDLKNDARKLLLSAQAPDVPKSDLVAGKVIHFKSYDGLDVPGILYVPLGAKKGDKLPAVIHVHGGPGDESRVGYHPLTQYLVNGGYVVFEINNRGSSGYGRTFFHLDDRRHGDVDLDDVVSARKMLVDTGFVDGNKVAIEGGSYGGYMVLAALAFRPQVFAAGVDQYGVSNWPRMLASTPSWWTDLRTYLFSEMGDPQRDADYLRRISPLFHADAIVRPLLVLQGANDPRVLPNESKDIVAKVKANGVPVRYIEFKDEGHGFRKKSNQIAACRAIRDFLDAHVRQAPARAGKAPTAGTGH